MWDEQWQEQSHATVKKSLGILTEAWKERAAKVGIKNGHTRELMKKALYRTLPLHGLIFCVFLMQMYVNPECGWCEHMYFFLVIWDTEACIRLHSFLFLFFISRRLMVFVIHWQESAMILHVFPILIPPPTSLSAWSLWVFPVHQVRALVSCIQPGLVICFTLDNIHVSMLKCPRTLTWLKSESVCGGESRWRRTRTGRSLSLLQIHRKNRTGEQSLQNNFWSLAADIRRPEKQPIVFEGR